MPTLLPTLWRIVLACVSCVSPALASGGDAIHKCVGPDGQSRYQATPCAPTHRTAWVRDYPAPPPPPVVGVPSAPAPRVANGRHRPRPAPRSGQRHPARAAQSAVISLYRDPVACGRAKQARDQAYARLGLKRDFATSRKLDDRVNNACR